MENDLDFEFGVHFQSWPNTIFGGFAGIGTPEEGAAAGARHDLRAAETR